MRRHLQRILLFTLALNLAPDVLAFVTSLIRTKDLRRTADAYFSIFTLTGLLSFFFVAVLFFFLYYYYFSKDRRWVFAIKFVLGLVAYVCFRYGLEEVLLPAVTGYHNYAKGTTLTYYFYDNLLFGLFYGGVGIVYYFIQRANTSESEKQLLLLEKQKAELSFLRSQINPHFLFNSLNNIYALVYHKNDQSLAAIQKLSELLRYILYAREEQVPVQKEMEYIKNYIDLELMRYNKPGMVEMKTNIENESITIVPLLLLPLVENAFKHGNLQSPQPISIHCEAIGQTLNFTVANLKANKQTDALGGVGLNNIRRRLELIYPGRHTLSIDDGPQYFTVNLQLAL